MEALREDLAGLDIDEIPAEGRIEGRLRAKARQARNLDDGALSAAGQRRLVTGKRGVHARLGHDERSPSNTRPHGREPVNNALMFARPSGRSQTDFAAISPDP